MLSSIQVMPGPGEITLAGMTLNSVVSGIVLRLARARSYLYVPVPEDRLDAKIQAYSETPVLDCNLAGSLSLFPDFAMCSLMRNDIAPIMHVIQILAGLR